MNASTGKLCSMTLAITVAMTAISARAAAVEVTSPDGLLAVTLDVKDVGAAKSCPVYGVTYKGKTVLAESRLGLELEGANLSEDMKLSAQTPSRHDETWKPLCAERDTIRDCYNQVVVDLQESAAPNRKLQITVRAYNEGAAFCYTLPPQDGIKDFTITRETTQFVFGGDYTTWPVYAAQGNYAGGEVPLSKVKPGAERPFTVRIADDLYASITEARVVEYARMKLRPVKNLPFAFEAFLDAEKGKYGNVTGKAPFSSPWRVVMAASSPCKLIEQNYIILNLNDPCQIQDTSWIKPGKVIREATLTTVGGKACVDFALKAGLQYIEYDAGWYGYEYDAKSDARAVHLDPKRNPDPTSLNLQEVIDYANSKGIGVILYVNHLAAEKQLDEILPLYQKWGVKGVKYGFVNVGSQQWTSWLHMAIRKAAECRLLVDIHDEFRNTGYQRTYPNLMTVEGILGNEGFPPAEHSAILPFTRFLTGPGDYTFCWYSGRLKNTHAHQLAISTIFFSPWQFLYWYDKPSMYKGEKELEYWNRLYTTWDETRAVQGEVARFVTVARRKGQEWFVGSIRPDGQRKLDVPLTFLEAGKKYTATVYSDANPSDPNSKAVKIETVPVDSTSVLKADIPANGGQAVRIVPAGQQ